MEVFRLLPNNYQFRGETMLRFITIEQFGITKTDEGRVVKISLTNNNGMKIELLNYGAILMSALVPDRNDILRDIVIGYQTLEGFLSIISVFILPFDFYFY